MVPCATESFLVFSDVHLGSDLDDRHDTADRRSASVDRDLVELLVHYRNTPPGADRWHIVVAGDFIDFIGMTIAPDAPVETILTEEERQHGLGGAADHARQKLRRVADRHADVFAALAAFVADGHALTFVHGNHDIELYWETVQQDLRAILLGHGHASTTRALDADAFVERIAFNPWFFWRSGVAFIEHGHQYDPFCATPHVMAPLSPIDPRRIARGFCDVLLRFVVRPTRGLKESGHEHVGITHYLAFGARLGLSGMAKLTVRFARAIRELFLVRRAFLSDAAKALRLEHDRRVAMLGRATRIGVDRLRALLALQVEPVTASVLGILASLLLDRMVLGLIAVLAIAALTIVMGLHASTLYASAGVIAVWALFHMVLSRRRKVDPAAQMIDRAARLARLFPCAFVVMGHTHAPAAARVGPATYVNVGSWAEQESDEQRAARTHLVIHVTPGGPQAELCTWSPEGPRPLIPLSDVAADELAARGSHEATRELESDSAVTG